MSENGNSSGEEENGSMGETHATKRHVWSEEESMASLRLFLVKDGPRLNKKGRGVLWRTILKELNEGGYTRIKSDRSVRDHVQKVLKTFRKENPKLERITGDPEEKGFTERHILILDICLLEDETQRYQDKLKGNKSLDVEKRDRAEKKLMIAAKNGRKKRGEDGDDVIGESAADAPSGTPMKIPRITLQRSMAMFFEAKTEEKSQQLKLDEEKLALEREKLGIEKEKIALETLKELEKAKDAEASREKQAKEAETYRESMKFMQHLMTKLVEKQTGPL